MEKNIASSSTDRSDLLVRARNMQNEIINTRRKRTIMDIFIAEYNLARACGKNHDQALMMANTARIEGK